MVSSDSISLLMDKLHIMKKQESTIYKRSGVNVVATMFDESNCCDNWRQTIVSWMYYIADMFKLNDLVVSVTSYYLDVAVEKGLVKSPVDYQLVALTALQLSIQLYEFKILPVEELVKLGHDFTQQDVKQMETKLIKALDWKLHPPTPNCFLELYMSVWPHQQEQRQQHEQDTSSSCATSKSSTNISTTTATSKASEAMKQCIESTAQQLIQVAVSRDEFIGYPPSIIAYAAVLLVTDGIEALQTSSTTVPSSEQESSLVQIRNFIVHIQRVSELSRSSPGFKQAFRDLEPFIDDDRQSDTSSSTEDKPEKQQRTEEFQDENPAKSDDHNPDPCSSPLSTNEKISEDSSPTRTTTMAIASSHCHRPMTECF